LELQSRLQQSTLYADDMLAHPSLSVLYQKKGMLPETEGAKGESVGVEAAVEEGLAIKFQILGNFSLCV